MFSKFHPNWQEQYQKGKSKFGYKLENLHAEQLDYKGKAVV